MKNFKCINGHEFDMPETQGEEWTETDVCPICKTDNFDLNHGVSEPKKPQQN